jgi:glycosidase
MRLLLSFLAGLPLLAAPAVTKIEPPSWWCGSTWSPVRLLLRGTQLAGARVTAQAPLAASRISVSSSGTTLFADLVIPATAQPGRYTITVTTRDGAAQTQFELLPALARTGRFQGFSPSDVLYLLMPDRFSNGDPSNDDPASAPGLHNRAKPRYYHGGDLAGVTGRIPYLKELGVTALWLNPWYDNVDHLNAKERYNNQDITDYHGYGAIDFYAVDQHLGDLATLQRTAADLRRAGIKLVQDQVANHTGPYHPWVQDPPTPTWFNGSAEEHLANDWQTWTLLDPHATRDTRRTTLDGWFINILPDLNQDDPETRRYLIQNSLWWVGAAGLDAIRQDTMPYVPRSYWRDWMAALKREFPRLQTIGEVLDGDPAFVAFYQTGRAGHDRIDTGIDTMFDFPLMFALRRSFGEGKALRETAKVLAHDALYPHPERLVTFVGLHDVPRFMSEPGATPEGLMLAYSFLLTARGIPMIYYGDEIAMPGGGDPDNRRDFPGGWPGDARDAFTAAGRTATENKVFDHLRRLIALRKSTPALQRGATRNLLVTEQQWAYSRSTPEQTVIVVLNNGSRPAQLNVPGVARELNVPARSALILDGKGHPIRY